MSNDTKHTEHTEVIDPHDLEAIYNAANPNDEFIVKIDFSYCDVSYDGYQILSEEELGILLDGLRSGAQIGTPNMPGSWYENFDICNLEGAFTVHSSDPDDVKAMRSLFGESVGETSYFGLVFNAFHETLKSHDDSGSEKESPDHIDLGVAERFLENPDDIDLCDASTIDDAAAESLSKHQGLLSLRALTELSDAVAEALSKHQGDLYLDGLTELSNAAAEALSKYQGEICEMDPADWVASKSIKSED